LGRWASLSTRGLERLINGRLQHSGTATAKDIVNSLVPKTLSLFIVNYCLERVSAEELQAGCAQYIGCAMLDEEVLPEETTRLILMCWIGKEG
jgi:hypothetical protein